MMSQQGARKARYRCNDVLAIPTGNLGAGGQSPVSLGANTEEDQVYMESRGRVCEYRSRAKMTGAMAVEEPGSGRY